MSATQIAGPITDINAVQTLGNTIPATVTAPIAPNTFTFWAGFNGTNNMSSNPAYSGDVQSTAIGAMYKQIFEANKANVVAREYDSVGTPGTALGSSVFPTQQAIATAQLAYNDFAEQASSWLQSNPGGSVTTMLASFSRGSIAAAVFSQMLYEKGLVTLDGRMLVPPGQVGVSANLVISGVNTGGNGDVPFAPNVQNSVQVVAANEYRIAYEQDIYGGTTKVIYLPGNHGDLGGFYPGGLGAIYLQDYTDFMNAVNPGMAGTVLPSRQYQGGAVDIHAEVVTGLTTLQNLANGSLADGTTTSLHNINPLGTSEVTPTGDVLKFVDYKGDTIEAVRVGGVIQSITRTPPSYVGGPAVTEYRISAPTDSATTTNPDDGSTTVIAKNAAGITLQSTTTLANGDIVQTNFTNGVPSSVTKTSIIASDGSKTVGLYDATGNTLQASVTTHVVDNGTGLITTSEIAQDGSGALTRVVETVQDLSTKVTTTTQLNLDKGVVIGKTVTTIDNAADMKTQNIFDANDVQISNVIQLSSGELDRTSYVAGQSVSVTKTLQSATGLTTVYVFDGGGANLQAVILTEQNAFVDSVSGGKINTISQTIMDGSGATISAGILYQTVDTTINGQAVKVTYSYDANGNPIPHVNSINNQPPIDQASADAAFQDVNPGQLAQGDAGVAGTNVAGAVTANDAAHPNGLQTLNTAIPNVISALSFISAIQRGEELGIIANRLPRVATQDAANDAMFEIGRAA